MKWWTMDALNELVSKLDAYENYQNDFNPS
jgi:hypothetical protein